MIDHRHVDNLLHPSVYLDLVILLSWHWQILYSVQWVILSPSLDRGTSLLSSSTLLHPWLGDNQLNMPYEYAIM